MTTGARLKEFDFWREGYGGATVTIYVGGTTTLAQVWEDIECTVAADNPQTLDTKELDEYHQAFGKWAQPLYTTSPYHLRISTGERSGIETPPLISMDGVDISLAEASARHGDSTIVIADWLERTIDVLTYGEFSPDTDTTTTTETLNAAIGVAAAQGGGFVLLPPGSVEIQPITLPEGVVLRGSGVSATTLRCPTANTSIVSIGGDGAGLQDLVLDGVVVPENTYGVDALNCNSVVFDRCLVRRFETGVRLRGGSGHRWTNFSVASCGTGALLAGDLDTASTGLGAMFGHCVWTGGAVAFNTDCGVQLRAVDALCTNIALHNIQFEANLADSLLITGARDVRAHGCWFHSNLTSLKVQDNEDTPLPTINTASRITFDGGFFDGAANGTTLFFAGECDLIRFRGVDFINCDFDLDSPQRTILLTDCKTDAETTVQGVTQFLMRRSTDNGGQAAGTTSGAVTVSAYSETVPPGESWIMDAKVVGKRVNGTERGSWWITGTVDRPAATLAYVNVVTPFTVGLVVTGQSSGASARIVADSAGTLSLIDITGDFTNNEVIADTGGGEAQVSGTLSTTNAVLSGAGSEDIKTPDDGFSGAVVEFAANSANAELQFTGVASHDIEWTYVLNIHKS